MEIYGLELNTAFLDMMVRIGPPIQRQMDLPIIMLTRLLLIQRGINGLEQRVVFQNLMDQTG